MTEANEADDDPEDVFTPDELARIREAAAQLTPAQREMLAECFDNLTTELSDDELNDEDGPGTGP